MDTIYTICVYVHTYYIYFLQNSIIIYLKMAPKKLIFKKIKHVFCAFFVFLNFLILKNVSRAVNMRNESSLNSVYKKKETQFKK